MNNDVPWTDYIRDNPNDATAGSYIHLQRPVLPQLDKLREDNQRRELAAVLRRVAQATSDYATALVGPGEVALAALTLRIELEHLDTVRRVHAEANLQALRVKDAVTQGRLGPVLRDLQR
jgi:hypothetical protein